MNKYFNEDAHRLAIVVQKVCMLNMFKNSRERRYIQARMMFSYILKERGYGCSLIGKMLNKTHASIINYFNGMWWYIKTDDSFKRNLELIKKEFESAQIIKNPKTKKDLKKLIHYLEGQNVLLSLTNSSLNEENKKLKKQIKVYGNIN